MNIKKILKKLFVTSTLGALFPVLLVPDTEGNESNASNDGNGNGNLSENDNGNNNNTNNDGDESEDEDTSGGQVTFKSQAELDATIQRRINKAVKKAQQQKDAEHAKSQMTEVDRLKHEKDEAEKLAKNTLEQANNRLIKADVILHASKMNVVDCDAAYQLLDKEDISIDENGKITGVETALKKLIAEKKYLVGTSQGARATGDDQNHGNKPTGDKFSMNNLIRRAAGRSD